MFWVKLLRTLIFIPGLAIGIWIVSYQVKMFLEGHNPDALPSLLVTSGVLTLVLSIQGYYSAWYSSSINTEDRYYSIRFMLAYEMFALILGMFNKVMV